MKALVCALFRVPLTSLLAADTIRDLKAQLQNTREELEETDASRPHIQKGDRRALASVMRSASSKIIHH